MKRILLPRHNKEARVMKTECCSFLVSFLTGLMTCTVAMRLLGGVWIVKQKDYFYLVVPMAVVALVSTALWGRHRTTKRAILRTAFAACCMAFLYILPFAFGVHC